MPETEDKRFGLQRGAGWKLWLRNGTIAGVLGSLIVHIVMLLIANGILFSDPAADLGPGSPREGLDFSVISQAEFAELTQNTATEQAVDLSALAEPVQQVEFESSLALNDLDARETLVPSLSGPSAGEGVDSGLGLQGVGAGFFGIEAGGKRFAFVLDKSGSMNWAFDAGGPSKWQRLAVELVGAVSNFEPDVEFVAMLFSQRTIDASRTSFYEIVGGRMRWQAASSRAVDDLKAALRDPRNQPSGGTNVVPAIRKLGEIRPRPDAIYLLSDGAFDLGTNAVEEIVAIAAKFRCPVHCITMIDLDGGTAAVPGSDDARAIRDMTEIANRTGGTYRNVGAS